MRIRKATLTEIALLLVFKALLEIAYIVFVNPIYAYMGFYLQLNALKLLESYLLLVVLFLFLPPRELKPSAIGLKLLFVLAIVPTLSLYALKDESRPFLYLVLAGFWCTLCAIRILPRIRLASIKDSVPALVPVLAIIFVLAYGGLLAFAGLPKVNLDLGAVYEIRTGYVQGLPRFMLYLVLWQANVVNSFLIALAWHKRWYFGLVGVGLLQVALFMYTGMKSVLLGPALVLFLVYAVQKRCAFRLTLQALILGLLFSLGVYRLAGSIMLPSLFIRRAFFVPAQNYFNYYDFFSRNQLMYLSQSILGFVLDNPYSMRVSNMMGELYYGNPSTSVNTGYLADAYMNFGAPGVLIFSFLLGVLLVVLDSIAKKSDVTLAVAVTAVPMISLVNSALLTTLLTHGFLVALLVLWLSSKTTSHSLKARACAQRPP